MPKVSIIIPTYNCVQYISEALESVLSQTFRDFEAIVIDDGSTDSTREIVGQYISRYPSHIRYIFQENQGLAVVRNNGIQHSQGEYIALLDSDDKWLPNRLAEEMRIIESDSSIGLVHANVNFISEEGKFIETPYREKKFLSGMIFEHIFLRKADIACATVLFRKECFQRVGGFDKNLNRLGCEDRELWLRIAKEYKFAYVDQVLAHYRIRVGSMSRNVEKMLKARLYVVDKHCPQGKGNNGLRSLALAKIYRDLGDELLLKGIYNEASGYYKKALAYNPFSFWIIVNLLKAVMKIGAKDFS